MNSEKARYSDEILSAETLTKKQRAFRHLKSIVDAFPISPMMQRQKKPDILTKNTGQYATPRKRNSHDINL